MIVLTDKEIRTRLISRGASALSDAELLSLIVGDSINGLPAYTVAKNILDTIGGSLSGLSECSISKLRMIESLGVKRAALIVCAVELGIRVGNSESEKIAMINTESDILNIFRPIIGRLLHEEMWVLYLSSANTILDRVKVSQGGVDGLYVDTKVIIKRSIELLASSIVIVHNHPSGVLKPSKEDIVLTDRIVEVSTLFGVKVLDHMIITADSSFSFRNALML